MAIIGRLIALPPEAAEPLAANPSGLAAAVDAAKIYADVYRYWDGIQFLLASHSPESIASKWRLLGKPVSTPAGSMPASRVLDGLDVDELGAELIDIEPEDLVDDYDAAAMDAAGIYPGTWLEWEETFDPLGQVLEHYHFLRSFVAKRAANGEAMLLHYEDDGEG